MKELYQELHEESEPVDESRAREIEDGIENGDYSDQDVFDLVQEVKRLRGRLDRQARGVEGTAQA